MQQLFLSIPPLFTRKQRQDNAPQRQRADEQSPFATMQYRRPTFTYSPPACRRFGTFPRSMAHSPSSSSTTSSFGSSPSSITSTPCTLTPDSESLASPTSSYFPPMPELAPGSATAASSSATQQPPQRYVSFPDLDTLCDDCWVDVRVEPKDWCATDLQMEEYDEMLVGGVRLAYS